MKRKNDYRLNVCVDPRGLFTWESQVCQYPEFGPPGIDYYRGDIGDGQWVDCLLWRDDDGRIVGICNHYPTATPWEDPGNINIWIHPDHQRRGIGTRLVLEAMRRYDVDLEQQRYTLAGARLAKKIIEDYVMREPITDNGAAMIPVKHREGP